MLLCRHMPLLLAAALMLSTPALTACSSHVGGSDYKASQAQQSYSAYMATVVSVQPVTIHGDSSGRQTLGGILGAVAGGLVGSTIGSGAGSTLAAAGGSILGGVAGAGAGSLTAQEQGLQIVLNGDNGSTEVVVQGAEPPLQPGQRVSVIVGADGSRRVVPAY